MIARFASILVMFAALPLLTGCGRSFGDVSGTVRYQGQPLPKGSITFYDEANQSITSPLDADGRYTVRKVAVGRVKVAVSLPMYIAMKGDTKGMAKMAAERKTLPNLPARYADAEKSGLDREVTRGSQTIDFDLK